MKYIPFLYTILYYICFYSELVVKVCKSQMHTYITYYMIKSQINITRILLSQQIFKGNFICRAALSLYNDMNLFYIQLINEYSLAKIIRIYL